MQDMEFTVEDNGKLYMLQTRNGKRTAQAAAIKIACDLIDEGMITEEEARHAMIDARSRSTLLLHPQFDAAALKKLLTPIGKGIACISRRSVLARSCFTAEDAVEHGNERGEKVVLVRLETSPEDIEGMKCRTGHSDRPRRS